MGSLNAGPWLQARSQSTLCSVFPAILMLKSAAERGSQQQKSRLALPGSSSRILSGLAFSSQPYVPSPPCARSLKGWRADSLDPGLEGVVARDLLPPNQQPLGCFLLTASGWPHQARFRLRGKEGSQAPLGGGSSGQFSPRTSNGGRAERSPLSSSLKDAHLAGDQPEGEGTKPQAPKGSSRAQAFSPGRDSL